MHAECGVDFFMYVSANDRCTLRKSKDFRNVHLRSSLMNHEGFYFNSLNSRNRKYANTAQIDTAHSPAEIKSKILPEKFAKPNI